MTAQPTFSKKPIMDAALAALGNLPIPGLSSVYAALATYQSSADMELLSGQLDELSDRMAALKTAINEPDYNFIKWLRSIDPNMASPNAAMLFRSIFKAKLRELDQGNPVLSLESYKKVLTTKYKELPFTGLWEHGDPCPLPLDNVFVMPEVEPANHTSQLSKDVDRLKQKIIETADSETREKVAQELDLIEHGKETHERVSSKKACSFLDVFKKDHRLVLLGRPGSGKTTLIKWLARSVALGDDVAKKRLELEGGLMPVVVSIGGFADARQGQDSQLSFAKYVERLLLQEGYEGLLPAYQNHLADGKILYLIDGLDEVPDISQRICISKEIENFLLHLEGNRVLITSRIVGYTLCRINYSFPHHTLLSFSDDQIKVFAKHWYRSLEQTLNQDTADLAQADRDAEGLLEEFEHFAFRDMIRNPLLLTLAALVRKARIKLPERRAEFYEELLKKLTETWVLVRSLSGIEAGRRLDARDVKAAWAPVAYWMHEERPTGFARIVQVEEHLEKSIVILLDCSQSEARETARKYFVSAVESIGLVELRGEDHLAFAHQTFQEYLAAQQLCTPKDKVVERAIQKCLDSHWSEVIRLAAGYLDLRDDTPLVDALVTALVEDAPPIATITGRGLELAMGIALDRVRISPTVQKGLSRALLLGYLSHEKIRERIRLHQAIKAIWSLKIPDDMETVLASACRHQELSVCVLACIGLAKLPSLTADTLEQLKVIHNKKYRGDVNLAAKLALLKHGYIDRNIIDLSGLYCKQPFLSNLFLEMLKSTPWVRRVLNECLSSQDYFIRLAGAVILSQIDSVDPDLIKTWIDLLGQEDIGKLVACIQAFTKMNRKIPGLADAWIGKLGCEAESVFWITSKILLTQSDKPPDFIEALTGLLLHEDIGVRFRAIQDLSILNLDVAGLANVWAELLGHEDSKVRLDATEALMKINSNATSRLAELWPGLLDHENVLLRLHAAEALSFMNWNIPVLAKVLTGLLGHTDDRIRLRAANALVRINQVVPNLAEVLADFLNHENRFFRLQAVLALNRVNQKVSGLVEAWVGLLVHEDINVRWSAQNELIHMNRNCPHLVAVLVGLLGHEDVKIRLQATTALSYIKQDIPGLAEAWLDLLAHDNVEVRLLAAEEHSIGESKVPGLAEVWSDVLVHDDTGIRFQAAEAQYNADNLSRLELCIRLLSHENDYIKLHAAKAISRFDRELPRLTETWAALLVNKDVMIRMHTADALSRIDWEFPGLTEAWVRLLIDGNPSTKLDATELLSRLPHEPLGLIEALAGLLPDEEIANQVLSLLSKIVANQALTGFDAKQLMLFLEEDTIETCWNYLPNQARNALHGLAIRWLEKRGVES